MALPAHGLRDDCHSSGGPGTFVISAPPGSPGASCVPREGPFAALLM